MQKVVHASLHGNAFAIEESGYAALEAYLAGARTQLAADPDRDEILGDLEQAIADKCARHLAPHKTVVTTEEMRQVLDEMGPVGTAATVGPETPPAAQAAPTAGPVRRLYRVLEGGKLAGLCNGLGAYFGVDANIVRVLFVVLTIITQGAWLTVYLVLVFVVPAAGTPEERAAAHGLPFSAQQLIDEAKRHYANLEKELQGPWAHFRASWSNDWRASRDWRAARREARQAAREARRAARASWTAPAAAPPVAGRCRGTGVRPAPLAPLLREPLRAAGGGRHHHGGAGLPERGLLDRLALGLRHAAGQRPDPGLVARPAALGQPAPHGPRLHRGRPAAGSFARGALHRSSYRGAVPWLAAWYGILWIAFAAFLGWAAWHVFPEIRGVAYDLPGAFERVRDSWQASH